MIVALVLLFVGLSALVAASGTARFIPGLEQPDEKVGWRRRLGFDPMTRSRPKVVLTSIGLSLLSAGVVTLLVVLIERAVS